VGFEFIHFDRVLDIVECMRRSLNFQGLPTFLRYRWRLRSGR
jgi:hypothetical protein